MFVCAITTFCSRLHRETHKRGLEVHEAATLVPPASCLHQKATTSSLTEDFLVKRFSHITREQGRSLLSRDPDIVTLPARHLLSCLPASREYLGNLEEQLQYCTYASKKILASRLSSDFSRSDGERLPNAIVCVSQLPQPRLQTGACDYLGERDSVRFRGRVGHATYQRCWNVGGVWLRV